MEKLPPEEKEISQADQGISMGKKIKIQSSQGSDATRGNSCLPRQKKEKKGFQGPLADSNSGFLQTK